MPLTIVNQPLDAKWLINDFAPPIKDGYRIQYFYDYLMIVKAFTDIFPATN